MATNLNLIARSELAFLDLLNKINAAIPSIKPIPRIHLGKVVAASTMKDFDELDAPSWVRHLPKIQ